MYLRTPKRYRSQRRRRLRLISGRTLLALVLIPLAVLLAQFIWNNRDEFRSKVLEEADKVAANVQTQVAPALTPTPTPNLETAQIGCSAYRQEAAGDIERAIEQCSLLADNSPNDVDLHFKVTHMLIVTSDFGNNVDRLNDALAYAEKTISSDPRSPHGWAIRAMALDWSGDYGSALASALQAKALDETFAPTYAFLGEIYHDLGQNEIALSYLEQAIELDTVGLTLADAFRTQGLIYSNQGYYDDAIAPYERAWQLAPNHTYIAVELANNYIALGQVDDAIRVLNQSLDQNPGNPVVLWALGYAYLRSGNRERAYEFYRRCLDTDPENISCLSYLGGLYYLDGDVIMAIANLEQAIELGSTDPDDFLELGRSYAAQGRCDQAIPYLQQGYQITQERGLYDKQSSFATELQSCGIPVGSGQ